jgi:hypothetical protein
MLGFRRITLRYPAVRRGAPDALNVQATLKTKLGIWAHIVFPTGKHLDYYQETNHKGHWKLRFTVPRHSVTRYSRQAYITLQLWHGSQTTQAFVMFTVM